MTMHYELKCRQEVCFKAKIGLTGLIVNSKAKNLNSKARATPIQRLEVSVFHVVDRVCTVLYILII